MAAAAGIFMNVLGMGESAKAGAQARAAGELGAQSIMSETRTNIEQTKKSQAQTLGMAKAIAAASGIKFDARKIAGVKFTEGGLTTGKRTEKEWEAGHIGGISPTYSLATEGTLGGTDFTTEEMLIGGSSFHEKSRDVAVYGASEDYGRQFAGAAEGDSTFTYLREMKKEFSKDIGWQAKQGASRAKVAQLGGTVAYAQAKSSVYQQGASTARQGYDWWKGSRSTAGKATA